MEAWQKREMEQKEFLKKLHRDAVHDDQGEYLEDDNILRVAKDLLEAVIYDMIHDNRSGYPLSREINGFARTEAEGMTLKRRLLVMLIKSGFHDAESEHLRERAHEQEKLYEGHRAMDEIE